MNPYQKLLSRKRTWTPIQSTAGKLKEGSEETIFRALALRHMELPVGDFIQDACSNEIPEASRALLESNVKDEIRHDLALGYITNALGVDEQAEKKPSDYGKRGLNIQIIRSSKQWWPSVRSFSFSSRSFVLTVMLVSER